MYALCQNGAMCLLELIITKTHSSIPQCIIQLQHNELTLNWKYQKSIPRWQIADTYQVAESPGSRNKTSGTWLQGNVSKLASHRMAQDAQPVAREKN
jgi:hypothetical protein